MSLILKDSPVGVDKPINTIQNALYGELVTNGAWTNYESYPRAHKNETENGIKPELFTGNGNDYVDAYMDDKFTVTSFFLVPDNIPNEDDMRTANISVIFQANLNKLYTTAPHRFDAEMHNQIETILIGLDGRFSFIDTHTSLDDVYAGLDTDQVQLNNTHPCHVVRFEIEANYIPECDPAFATSGVTCNIAVSVSTTDETVLGDNDGTATANDTGGQGTISYLWTTIVGSIPVGEEIKKTATGLSAGTYTVVVTDSITSPCTATDSGAVAAGTFDPSGLPNLLAWVRADDNNSFNAGTGIGNLELVSDWLRQTGSSVDLSQATILNQPVYHASGFGVNSTPFVDFDGINIFISSVVASVPHPYTVFIAIRKKSNAATNMVLTGNTTTSSEIYTTSNSKWNLYSGMNIVGPDADTSPVIVKGVYNSTSSKIGINADAYVTGNSGTQSLDVISIGATTSGTFPSPHEIAEVIIYTDDKTSSGDDADVVSYLNSKYAIY